MNSRFDNPKSTRRLMLVAGAAAIAMAQAVPAQADDAFEMMVHETPVFGAGDIETGNYTRGIERLTSRLADSQPHGTRSPMLIDLCVAYTMSNRLTEAKAACDKAVETGWNQGLALNNRGAYHIASGNIVAAVRDFQAAVEARGAQSVATRNLERAQLTLAKQQELVKPGNSFARNIDTSGEPSK